MTVRAELHDGTVLEFPEGTSDDVIQSTVKRIMASPPKTGVVNNVGAGINESLAQTVGGPVDIVNWALRKAGVPVSDDPIMGSDWLKNRLGDVGIDPRQVVAESDAEKIARGAARGITDAAGIALPAGAVANAAKSGSMTQGVAASLASQPMTQAVAGGVGGAVGEATDNPLLGIAASLGVPLAGVAGARAITPVRSQLTVEQARLAEVAAKEGIPLTPAQATGSRPLQTIEGVFSTLPMTSGAQREIADIQRSALNRSVLSRAGVSADKATPEVIDDAFRELGQRFDDLAKRTTVNVDHQMFKDVDNIVSEYGRRLPTDVAPVFQSYVDDLNQMRAALGPAPAPGSIAPAGATQGNSVQIPGDAFQNVVSGIRARARSAANNPALQTALNALANAVDETMARSATPQIAKEWRQARRDYRNLLTVDRAMSGGTQAERSSGDIPLASLRQSVRKDDARGYARGRGDLNELSRVADFIGSSRVPNSGTAERTTMSNLMTGAPIGAGVGAAAVGADPLTSVLLGLFSAGVPRAIQMAYNSPAGRTWLTNQVAANAGPAYNTGLLASLLGGDAKRYLPAKAPTE